jgi:sigma-B regulation protein RsbU (phosphoserine phosphatase)
MVTDVVGGDYYDVIHVGGHHWILIGDVSGHGVPAGLVMMMCHTAVHTVLHESPGIMPDALLSRVNTVLTQNIRQLGEDKYMTISAFRFESDGKVKFAGAHQDVQIYRAATDTVEVRETSGVWLGVKPDIANLLSTNEFSLDEGDVVALYTDGITEAMRDGRIFDTRGVRRVLGKASGRNAEQVLSDMFNALVGYTVNDDATMVVVKQLGGLRIGPHRAETP